MSGPRQRRRRGSDAANVVGVEPRAPVSLPLWWVVAGVSALAFAVRLLHLWDISRAPFFPLLMGDALSYDLWARRLAAGDWLGTGVFYQAPLYPYLLGGLYALGAQGPTAVRIVQAVAGAMACGLVAIAGTQMFGRREGLTAGVLLALYAPAIFYDSLIQKTAIDSVILCWMLVVVARLAQRPTVARSGWAGVALGALALVRENALVLLPVLLAWLWLQSRRTLAPVLALTLGFAAVLMPVAIRNQLVGGEFYLTTSQLGANLYIGNHDGATGTYVPLRSGHGSAADERRDATELAEEALGRPPSPAEVSQYWRAKAISWILGNPEAWAKLTGKKVLLVWNATEATDTEDLYTYSDWSRPLRISGAVLHFGVLAPLAVLGLWITRSRWRALWVFYAMGAAYATSVAAFYVLGRYRYPLVPLLVLFAGAALVDAPGWWRRTGLKERLAAVGLVGLISIVGNWTLLSVNDMRASTLYNIGREFQRAGQADKALAEYRRAIELQPASPTTLTNLGVLLAARGEHDEAMRLYTRALAIDPNLAAAHTDLGIELAAQGRQSEAIGHFERALVLDRRDAAAHFNLGTALAMRGDREQAISHLADAIQLDPSNASAHNSLGVLLASAGRLNEAIEHFQTALRLQPGFEEAKMNLTHASELRRKLER